MNPSIQSIIVEGLRFKTRLSNQLKKVFGFFSSILFQKLQLMSFEFVQLRPVFSFYHSSVSQLYGVLFGHSSVH